MGPGGKRVERKGGVGDGAEDEGEEGELAVVAGDAVGAEGAAAGAVVDEGPLAVAADLDGDGLEGFAARIAAVAGLIIDVAGPETERTVIAVGAAQGV